MQALRSYLITELPQRRNARIVQARVWRDARGLRDVEPDRILIDPTPSHRDKTIWQLVALADNRYVASGSCDHLIRIWDVEEAKCIASLDCKATITALLSLPNGRLACIAGGIQIWDIESKTCVMRLRGEREDYDAALAVLPDGRLVCGRKDTIEIWNLRTAKCELIINMGCLSLLTLSQNLLLAGLASGRVVLLDISTPEQVVLLGKHEKAVPTLVLLANGCAASGSVDGTAKIWDIPRGECIATLPMGRRVDALVVLPGNYLAASHQDAHIQLWDLTEKSCVATYLSDTHFGPYFSAGYLNHCENAMHASKHSRNVIDTSMLSLSYGEEVTHWEWQIPTPHLAVLADGKLVIGSNDGTVKVWPAMVSQASLTIDLSFQSRLRELGIEEIKSIPGSCRLTLKKPSRETLRQCATTITTLYPDVTLKQLTITDQSLEIACGQAMRDEIAAFFRAISTFKLPSVPVQSKVKENKYDFIEEKELKQKLVALLTDEKGRYTFSIKRLESTLLRIQFTSYSLIGTAENTVAAKEQVKNNLENLVRLFQVVLRNSGMAGEEYKITPDWVRLTLTIQARESLVLNKIVELFERIGQGYLPSVTETRAALFFPSRRSSGGSKVKERDQEKGRVQPSKGVEEETEKDVHCALQ